MTRCIFRKPKRHLNLSHGLAIVVVMMVAALCLELQAGINPNQERGEGSPMLELLHQP